MDLIRDDVRHALDDWKRPGTADFGLVVSRVPGWREFNYGHPKQIGVEASPAAWLDEMLRVINGIPLDVNGEMVLILGDVTSGSKHSGGKVVFHPGSPEFEWPSPSLAKAEPGVVPAPRSHVVGPELLAASLAYGRNVLAGRWSQRMGEAPEVRMEFEPWELRSSGLIFSSRANKVDGWRRSYLNVLHITRGPTDFFAMDGSGLWDETVLPKLSGSACQSFDYAGALHPETARRILGPVLDGHGARRVLDPFCGSGTIPFAVEALWPGCLVTGVDINLPTADLLDQRRTEVESKLLPCKGQGVLR